MGLLVDRRKLIIRLLRGKEASGQEVYRELCAKGVKAWPNHVYTTLAKMERDGLLKSRWVENPKPTLPRTHIYSLSRKGASEYRKIIKDSLGLLMSEFIRSNLDVRELYGHVNLYNTIFSLLGIEPLTLNGVNVVTALPSPDPLICYPIGLVALSEALPNASIFVVKPPGTILDTGSRPNLNFVDGWRHNMPFREGFADYLWVDGFPNEVSEEDTIREYARVVKDDGHLIIQVPGVMTEEKKPRYISFSEFVLESYYDFYGDDRTISTMHVKELLSKYFKEATDIEAYGGTIFYSSGKNEKARMVGISERLTS